MYIKDKNGKRYEYRKSLEKYLNKGDYEFYGYVKEYTKKGYHKKLLLVDIHDKNGNYITNHNFIELSNATKKFLDNNLKYTQVGKKVRFIAKTYEYTNAKKQYNLGLKMYKVIEDK